jgi:methyl-accepting chemotaxis protein
MRSLPLRLIAATLVLAGLAACGSVEETSRSIDQGVNKARDCASLAEKVAGLNLNPNAAASEIEQGARDLERTVNELDAQDVKQAGQGLLDKVEQLAKAVRGADPAEVRRSLGEVRRSAEQVARACNVPVDQLLN